MLSFFRQKARLRIGQTRNLSTVDSDSDNNYFDGGEESLIEGVTSGSSSFRDSVDGDSRKKAIYEEVKQHLFKKGYDDELKPEDATQGLLFGMGKMICHVGFAATCAHVLNKE